MTEPSQRFQHGLVGFPCPVVLDTLPAANPQTWIAGETRDKGVNDRCLADPRLPRHEHHLSLSSQRLRQRIMQLGELCLSPNKGGNWELWSQAGSWGTGPPVCLLVAGYRQLTTELPNEPIPPPRYRLNEPRRCHVIP